MKMTTAIFDLDGTLLNSLGDLCDSVTYAVEKHGFPPVSMEQTRIRIGNGVRKLVERSIPEESRTDEMIDICLADFRAFYGEHMMNRTHPYEGIVSVLETLKENGVTVGVLSNKYDSAAKALIEHYFGDLVSITYGERPNIPRKPDPTSVLQLLDELGGDKKTTLYIGDSATDMQTAVNAGLTAIGVVWGFRSAEELRASGADALAYEPSDLLPLFAYGVPDVSKAEKALTGYGFGFHYFATKDEAVSYLRDTCAGKSGVDGRLNDDEAAWFSGELCGQHGRTLALDRQGRVLPDAGRLSVFSERTERDWRDRQHRRQVQPRGGHAVRTEALHFRVRREQAASRPAERHRAGKKYCRSAQCQAAEPENAVCGGRQVP